jgi:hypothetical protein
VMNDGRFCVDTVGQGLRGEQGASSGGLRRRLPSCSGGVDPRARAASMGRDQMNIGAALAELGRQEVSTSRLEEAVAAYRAALEEWTRERARARRSPQA